MQHGGLAVDAHEAVLQPARVKEGGVLVREVKDLRSCVRWLQNVPEEDRSVVVGADSGIMAELLNVPRPAEVHRREVLGGPGDLAAKEAMHELQPGRRRKGVLNDAQHFIRGRQHVAGRHVYERERVNIEESSKAEEEIAVLGNALPLDPTINC